LGNILPIFIQNILCSVLVTDAFKIMPHLELKHNSHQNNRFPMNGALVGGAE
jgi:hypothetical protein